MIRQDGAHTSDVDSDDDGGVILSPFARREALIVAHPGHELRVLGWLRRVKPTVFVLTDGSGSTGRSRLSATSRLLRAAGATPGFVYGPFRDAELYDALLGRKHDVFVGLVAELADALAEGGFGSVVGDAADGDNPALDVCRLMIDAAVDLVRIRTERKVTNYEFPLVAVPGASDGAGPNVLRIALSDEEMGWKLSAASAYAASSAEVRPALEGWGLDAFRVEELHIRPEGDLALPHENSARFYQEHGKRLLAAGITRRVLRYDDHVAPLVEVLRNVVQREGHRANPGRAPLASVARGR